MIASQPSWAGVPPPPLWTLEDLTRQEALEWQADRLLSRAKRNHRIGRRAIVDDRELRRRRQREIDLEVSAEIPCDDTWLPGYHRLEITFTDAEAIAGFTRNETRVVRLRKRGMSIEKVAEKLAVRSQQVRRLLLHARRKHLAAARILAAEVPEPGFARMFHEWSRHSIYRCHKTRTRRTAWRPGMKERPGL